MRGRVAMAIAFATAMLLARPVSADPFSAPSAEAGIGQVSLSSGSFALSDSGALPALSGGALAGVADPVKLGVFTVEYSNPGARWQVGSSLGDPPDQQIADAILNGVPAISARSAWPEPASVVTQSVLDLDAATPDPPDPGKRSTVAPPEPSGLLLLGCGLLGLALALFRRAKASEVAVRKANSLSPVLR